VDLEHENIHLPAEGEIDSTGIKTTWRRCQPVHLLRLTLPVGAKSLFGNVKTREMEAFNKQYSCALQTHAGANRIGRSLALGGAVVQVGRRHALCLAAAEAVNSQTAIRRPESLISVPWTTSAIALGLRHLTAMSARLRLFV
jgi:hypothetical protein